MLGTGRGPGRVEQWSVAWETPVLGAPGQGRPCVIYCCISCIHVSRPILCQAGWESHINCPFKPYRALALGQLHGILGQIACLLQKSEAQ